MPSRVVFTCHSAACVVSYKQRRQCFPMSDCNTRAVTRRMCERVISLLFSHSCASKQCYGEICHRNSYVELCPPVWIDRFVVIAIDECYVGIYYREGNCADVILHPFFNPIPSISPLCISCYSLFSTLSFLLPLSLLLASILLPLFLLLIPSTVFNSVSLLYLTIFHCISPSIKLRASIYPTWPTQSAIMTYIMLRSCHITNTCFLPSWFVVALA